MGILYAQLECWIIVSIQKHHGQNYILVPNNTRLGCECSLSEITALTLFCWTNSSLNVTTTLSDSVQTQYQFFYFRWHLDVFCAECHAHVTCRCSPALMRGLPTQHGRQPYLTTAISSSPSPSCGQHFIAGSVVSIRAGSNSTYALLSEALPSESIITRTVRMQGVFENIDTFFYLMYCHRLLFELLVHRLISR